MIAGQKIVLGRTRHSTFPESADEQRPRCRKDGGYVGSRRMACPIADDYAGPVIITRRQVIPTSA